MLASICSSRLAALACVKFRSRELTALNLLPSMATVVARKQAGAPADHDEFATDFADGRAIVLAEIRDGLEVRRQAAREPHHFDVPLAFPLKLAAGLNAVEVAVYVELQHHGCMVSGPSRQLRMHAPKAKLPEIELVDEKVDHPHRVFLGDIGFQLRRKHRSLSAIRPAHKARHRNSPRLRRRDAQAESLF